MFLKAGSHDCFALDRFGHVPHSDVNSWLSLRQKQMDELRTCHREQFLSLRSKIRSLEIEAGIASDANPFLRERQQMLLTSKKYGEAYEQLKVITDIVLSNFELLSNDFFGVIMSSNLTLKHDDQESGEKRVTSSSQDTEKLH